MVSASVGSISLTPSNLTLSSGGILSASGGTVTIAPSTTWSNAGTLAVSAGTLNLGGSFALTGLGSVQRSGGSVNVTGILDLGGSILDLGSNGVFGAGGLTSLNGGGARIKNGHLKDSDATPILTTSGYPDLEGITLDSNLTVNGFLDVYSGLTLSDGTTLTVNNGTVWLNGSGVSGNTQHLAKTSGASGATLVLNNSNLRTWDSSGYETLQIDAGVSVKGYGNLGNDTGANTIANYGSIDASVAGQTLFINPTTFVNAGLVKTSLGNLYLYPTNTYSNSAILEVAAGTTLYTNNHSLTNNAGGILRGAGTLNLGGNSYTLTNNGTLNVGDGASPGSGALAITGNLVNNGTLNFDLNGLARGVAGTGYDALSVTGTATLGGTLGVTAGAGYTAYNSDPFLLVSAGSTLSGTPTISTALAYNIQKPGNNYLFQVGATPATVVLWNTDSGGDWNTAGNWLQGAVPGAGQIALVDRGAAVTPALTLSGNDNVARLISTGSLALNGGTLTLSGSNSSLAGTLTLAGGNLAEAGAFKVGALTWDKGTVSGGGTLTSAGPVKLEPATGAHFDILLSGATLVNNDASGNSHWTGLADIRFANGASFVNNGSFVFQGLDAGTGRSIIQDSLGSGRSSFINNGTLTRSGTTWTTIGWSGGGAGYIDFYNQGGTVNINSQYIGLYGNSTWSGSSSINIASGATLYFNGGTHAFNSGSSIANAGALQVAGGVVTLNAGSDVTGAGSVTVSGGTLNVNGGYSIAQTGTTSVNGSGTANFNVPLAFAHTFTLTGSSASLDGSGDLVMNGAFNWSNNAGINGRGSLTTAAATSISSNGNYMNRHWINTGTVTLSSGDTNVELFNGTVFDNQGVFIVDSTRANPVANLWGGPAYFNNTGTLTWNGSGTQSIDSPIQLNNTGSVNVASGTLSAPGFADNAGSLNVASGATFQKSGGFTNTSTGVIAGSGSIDVGSGTLVNAGTLRPGGANAAGTLSITGNLANSGSIEMDLGGATPGSGYDRIAVSGSVQLGGSFKATLINGYTPTTGQDFDLITSTGASGSFTSFYLPTGMNGAIVDANIYRLTNSGITCTGVCWDGGGGADMDWSNPANWTGDTLPGVLDVVYLNLVSGVEATHTTGTDSIKGLNSSVGNSLTISGGSLTLNDAGTHSTLLGNLTVSGLGAFATLGTLNLANFTLTGGTVTASGSVSVADRYLQTGGTWSQVSTVLPPFSAQDFSFQGGAFVRALGGDGGSNPYQIADVYGLQGMAGSGLAMAYQLANDIDASGTSAWNAGMGFNPVGDGITPFTGTLYGAGHSISHLAIDQPNRDYVGLFGYLDTGAAISFTNVRGAVTGKDNVGLLVGYDGGTISTVTTRGEVHGTNYVGGAIGSAASISTLSDSTSSGTVNGGANVGGLVGGFVASGGTILHSSSDAAVTGSADHVGGLLGNGGGYDPWIHTNVTDSLSTGAVSGGDFVGGLVGGIANGAINNSYSTGSVSGHSFVGGLAGGSDYGGSIGNSYASGTVTATGDRVGGLVGYADNYIINSYATGAVIGGTYVGGLVGYNCCWVGSISNSYASGTVKGSLNVGGLVGYIAGGSVTDSYWDATVNPTLPDNGLGIGLTTVQMMSASSYPANFDFIHTWFLVEGATRPFLRMEWNPSIGNAHQLQLMAMNPSAIYTLAKDIDLSELSNSSGMWATTSGAGGFAPVGSAANPFTGSLDGAGHGIGHLNIDRPVTDNVGLFGVTGTTASITDVGLIDVSVTGLHNVGALVGSNAGSVLRDYATGTVTGGKVDQSRTGGLVGAHWGTGVIDSSYADVTVSGGTSTGGLVGGSDGAIANSYALGDVSGGVGVGGLVGGMAGSVSTSYSTGHVVGDDLVGGLVGYNIGSVTHSYWDVTVNPTLPDNGLGIGLTTVQMMSASSYPANFDFIHTWFLVEGATRPFLRMEWNPSIGNAHQLQLMAMNPSAIYTLAKDIDLSELSNSSGMWATTSGAGGFAPVGSAANPFTGSLDGAGHGIGHLSIDRPGSDSVGLFGNNAGTIGNVDVQGSVTGRNNVGLLAGSNSGTITSVATTNASVTATSDSVGGLVGSNSGHIDASAASGTVIGGTDRNTGGLVGYNSGSIADSSASGSVTNVHATAGVAGLAGSNWWGSITNSYSDATVYAPYSVYVGGLVGDHYYGTISGSYASGTVTGSSVVGGLVGFNHDSSISTGYASGNVSASGGEAGGLVGTSICDDPSLCSGSVSIGHSFASGSVSAGGAKVGGLVGKLLKTRLMDSYATGAVTGGDYVGGLVGWIEDDASVILRTFSTGTVTVTAGSNAGGLIGGGNLDVPTSVVSDSYWDMTTSRQSSSYAGVGKTSDFFSSPITSWSTSDWDFSGAHPVLISSQCAGYIDCWIGGTDTVWTNASNWLAGHVPVVGDSVNILSSASYHPDLEASGTYSFSRVLLAGDITTGSGVTLDINRLLTLAGGDATLNGTTAVVGFSQSGGALKGGGNFTVTQSYEQTGGNLNRPGDVTVTQASGNLGFSALQVGALNLSAASGNLNLGAIHAGGAVSATASGNITQNGDITSAATATAIVLAAGGGYSNSAGGLTAAGGRWLIYAATPVSAADKRGLVSDFRHYGATHSSYAAPSEAGNGFIYASAAGTLTVTPNAAESDYGNSPVTPGYTLSGFADNEDNAGDIGLGGTATFSGLPTQTSHAGSYGSVYNNGLSSAYGYGFAANGTTGSYTVRPREVTLTVNNDHRVYGDANPVTGTVAATPTAGSFVFGDSVGSVELSSNATVTTGANTAGQYLRASSGTLTAGSGSASAAGDYHFSYSDGTLSIDRRPVTVTADAGQHKTYGDADPALTYSAEAQSAGRGLVGNDSLSGSLTRDAGENVLAASGYAIDQGSVSNAANANYDIGYTGARFSIDPATATLLAVKTYDAGKNFTSSQITVSGVNGQSLLLTGVGNATARSKDVADNATNYLDSLGGADALMLADGTGASAGLASNYKLPSLSGRSANNQASVGKADLLLSGGKPYDASTVAAGGTLVATGVAGEHFTITGDGDVSNLGSANATANATANGGASALSTLTGLALGTSNDGGLSGNYTPLSSIASSYSVTRRDIALTAGSDVTGNRKYGDVSNPEVIYTVGGLGMAGGEYAQTLLAFTVASAATATTDAGTYGAGSANAYKIVGVSTGDHGNYNVTAVNDGTLKIDPASLSVQARDQAKTYGTPFDFTGSEFTPTGLKNGETIGSVTLASAATPASAAAGGYVITASGATAAVGGSFKASNYAITYQDGNFTVSPRDVTILDTHGWKYYDGTTLFNAGDLTLSGILSSDTVNLSGSANVSSRNAATYTAWANSSLSLSNSNYTLAGGAVSVEIKPKDITLTAPVISKVYDGTLGYTTRVVDLANLDTQLGVAGDTISQATLAYTDKHADSGKTVNLTGYTVADGNSGHNYAIAVAGNSASTIAQAPVLTVTANNAADKIYGDVLTFAGTEFTANGLQSGDTIASVTLTSAGAAATAHASATPYAVTPSVATGGYTATDYQGVTYVDGSLKVIPREVTLTVNNDHRVYGDANPVTGTVAATPTAGSFVFGDSVGSVELSSNATVTTGANTAGQYLRASSGTLIVGSGSASAAGDYHVSYSDGTLSIDRRPVTISGLSAQDKGYDNSTTAKLGYTDNRVSGDDLGLSYLANYSDVHAGANKSVTVTGGYSLTGSDAGNYSLITAGLPVTFTASITPAESAAWTGAGTSGNWSNAANWAGNLLPQAGDVKSVSIPAGVSVAYDAGAGATNLESLTSAGNLILSAGALSVGSALMSHGAALTVQGGSHSLGGLTLDGSLNVDAGSLQLQGGGHFAAGGEVNVAAPGKLQFAGGVFAVDSVVSNAGTLALQSGTTTFSERVSNSGLFAVQLGSAVFQAGYLQTAGSLTLGTSDVSGVNLAVGDAGLRVDGGVFNGTGTIRGDVQIGAATLAPGFSPGRLDIYGNLDLTSSSTTDIELWGKNLGQYDVLNVVGTAHLDGVLNVSTGNGYVPVAGDGLAFMNFSGGSTGGFARMNVPTGVSMTFGPNGLSAATQAAGVKQIVVYTNTQLSLGIVNQDTPTQLADTFTVTVLPLGGYSVGEILDAANNGTTPPDVIAIVKIDGEIKQLLDDSADHDKDHRLVCH